MKVLIAFLCYLFLGVIISAIWFLIKLYRYDSQDKKDGIKNDKRIIAKKRGRQAAPRNEK